jgi:hypothetical protein
VKGEVGEVRGRGGEGRGRKWEGYRISSPPSEGFKEPLVTIIFITITITITKPYKFFSEIVILMIKLV